MAAFPEIKLVIVSGLRRPQKEARAVTASGKRFQRSVGTRKAMITLALKKMGGNRLARGLPRVKRKFLRNNLRAP
jgi:hypothetical protein